MTLALALVDTSLRRLRGDLKVILKVCVVRIFEYYKYPERWSGAGFIEAPTTRRLRRRVGERHLAAARQNLPGNKAVPLQ